jgi:cytochrome c oxidase cbb3-type subunit 3
MFCGRAAFLVPLLVSPFFAFGVSAQTAASAGVSLFHSNCAFCHGSNASGGRGPNLLGALSHSDDPKLLEKVIKEGIPGTAMPGFDFEPEELAALLAYLKTVRKGNGSTVPVPGDPVAGRAIYGKQGCTGCHMINRDGSAFGPDLSRVGSGRAYEYLQESIVNPSADIPDEFRTVRIVTADGKSISGIRINEDTFSLQLRLPDQSFRSFTKATLRTIEYPNESLMPPYKLSASDLINLLAYLTTLRGDPADPSATATKTESVH